MEQGITNEPNLPSVYGDGLQRQNLIPSPHEMAVYNTMAKQAVQSKMYRNIGDESGIVMIMLAARELGIAPMQALNGGIHIIEGKVEISARLMGAMIRRAGHSITIKESTDERCVLTGKRCDNGDSATVSYSVQDAQRAGLIREKGGWKRVPKDMCFARAMSRLARQLFSDVIGIGYVEGEIPRKNEAEYIPEPENIEVEVETYTDEFKAVEDFLSQFEDKDERLGWAQYIGVVSEKLKWTRLKVVGEFSKDMNKTREKYQKWAAKQN